MTAVALAVMLVARQVAPAPPTPRRRRRSRPATGRRSGGTGSPPARSDTARARRASSRMRSKTSTTGPDFHIEAGLLLDFACDAGFERLAQFERAAWQAPPAGQRLVLALDQHDAVVVDDDGADADHRAWRVLPRRQGRRAVDDLRARPRLRRTRPAATPSRRARRESRSSPGARARSRRRRTRVPATRRESIRSRSGRPCGAGGGRRRRSQAPTP